MENRQKQPPINAVASFNFKRQTTNTIALWKTNNHTDRMLEKRPIDRGQCRKTFKHTHRSNSVKTNCEYDRRKESLRKWKRTAKAYDKEKKTQRNRRKRKRKHRWPNVKALSTLDENTANGKDNDYLVSFIAIYVNDYLFLFYFPSANKNIFVLVVHTFPSTIYFRSDTIASSIHFHLTNNTHFITASHPFHYISFCRYWVDFHFCFIYIII